MDFLDAAYYTSAPVFDSVLINQGSEDFAYYIGGNIALHPWNGADVIALRTNNRRGMGIHVTTVVGRNGDADGSFFAQYNRSAYGARTGDKLCLDLEPSVYRDNKSIAKSYCIAWAKAVKNNGLSPVLYCTPDGCADIGDKGFDAIWAAVPGNSDPGSIFNPGFFPGHVAVQWGQNTVNGVNFDISNSQFTFDSPADDNTGNDLIPVDTNPSDHWWGSYVSGADQVVELLGLCHANVFTTGGHWYKNNTLIGSASPGQFAEWLLANRIQGVWYVMDESGGPTGSPTGRLPVEDSFWIEDSVTDSTGCGGTNPPAVAQARGGSYFNLVTPDPIPNPDPDPTPTPTPQPDINAAVDAINSAISSLQDALKALQP